MSDFKNKHDFHPRAGIRVTVQGDDYSKFRQIDKRMNHAERMRALLATLMDELPVNWGDYVEDGRIGLFLEADFVDDVEKVLKLTR